MYGEVVLQGRSREGVRIPTDAVIHTGTRSVVFVALPGGKFQPREVQLGETNSDFVEVASGVAAGDGVVTRANFLVDSESRLRASLAALTQPVAPAAPADATQGPPAADPHAGHGR
jgi:membrane fusion protein, copper/silver efflux system